MPLREGQRGYTRIGTEWESKTFARASSPRGGIIRFTGPGVVRFALIPGYCLLPYWAASRTRLRAVSDFARASSPRGGIQLSEAALTFGPSPSFPQEGEEPRGRPPLSSGSTLTLREGVETLLSGSCVNRFRCQCRLLSRLCTGIEFGTGFNQLQVFFGAHIGQCLQSIEQCRTIWIDRAYGLT